MPAKKKAGATKSPGLRAWRSRPKADRVSLRKSGVNTRAGKEMNGMALRQQRKSQGLNPNTGAKASAATTDDVPTGNGIAPRGINAPKSRKGTDRMGNVSARNAGNTAGAAGVEAYRNTAGAAAAGGATTATATGGNTPRASKGRVKGAIKNPRKGGAGKRLIAKSGGGRAALQTFRAKSKPERTNLVAAAKQGANLTAMLRGKPSTTKVKRTIKMRK